MYLLVALQRRHQHHTTNLAALVIVHLCFAVTAGGLAKLLTGSSTRGNVQLSSSNGGQPRSSRTACEGSCPQKHSATCKNKVLLSALLTQSVLCQGLATCYQ